MSSCAIKWCSKSTRTSSIRKNGITFHRFPKDPHYRELWVKATARENWFPTANSIICSRHFTQDCFREMKNRRRLQLKAVPTIFLPILLQEPVQNSSGTNESDQITKNQASTSVDLPPAEDIVVNVYNYLQKEYEEFKSSIVRVVESIGATYDMGPLANILKRTAIATGVSEDAISAILENKKRAANEADEERDASAKRVKLTRDFEDGNVSPITDDESNCEEADDDDKEQEDDNEPTHDNSQKPIEFEVETLKVELEDGEEYKPFDPLQLQMSDPITDDESNCEEADDDDKEQEDDNEPTHDNRYKPFDPLQLQMSEEENRKERKRKKTNARQKAYYHRQKDLKKNEEIKKVPKSNAERQREFRQRKARKSYMDMTVPPVQQVSSLSNVSVVPSVSNTPHTKITQPTIVVYPQSSAGVLRVMSIEPITSLATVIKTEPEDEHTQRTYCAVQHQRSSNVGVVPSVSNTTHPAVSVYPQPGGGILRKLLVEPITSLPTIKTEPDDEQTHSSVTCTSDVACDTTLCDVKCEPPDS